MENSEDIYINNIVKRESLHINYPQGWTLIRFF